MLPVLPIPTPVRPEPLPTNVVAVMMPEVLMLPVLPIPTPVRPEPSPTNVVAVMMPLMDIPIVEVFPIFKTACKLGLEAVPVK